MELGFCVSDRSVSHWCLPTEPSTLSAIALEGVLNLSGMFIFTNHGAHVVDEYASLSSPQSYTGPTHCRQSPYHPQR